MIDPAQKFEGAIGQESAQITGLIQPGPRLIGTWVRHEGCPGERGTMPVAPSDSHPSDVDFARLTDRHRLTIAVQNV